MRAMSADLVRLLRCPVCGAPLLREERALRCVARHSFDIARQGYVTLLAGRAPAGDTAPMVAAREAFLSGGHYRWLAEAVADHARGEVILDAGAGTGYYLAAALERTEGAGIALDSSGYALRRAVRAHPRILAVRADLWRRLPIGDGVVDLVLNVFAPRNAAEFHRALRPGGRLLTVTPTSDHLAELVDRLGLLTVDQDKDRRLSDSLGQWFTRVAGEARRVPLRLTHADVRSLVAMGPSAWHTDSEAIAARIAELPEPTTVTASCQITLWERREGGLGG